MSIAERVSELLALPTAERALLARELLSSLDDVSDENAESEWQKVVEQRSYEIEMGLVKCRPASDVVQEIREMLDARRQPS
jgi:hypothetical protein